MSKLQNELDELLTSVEGGGFGDPDALRDFERKVENLRFKINRGDKYKIAILSASIAAFVSVVTITLSSLID